MAAMTSCTPVLDGPLALLVMRAEFNEMPGMHLTLAQARRLWPMADGACEQALETLVSAGFLVRDHGQAYCRRADVMGRSLRRQQSAHLWR